MEQHNEQEPRTVAEAQAAAREEAQETPRVHYLAADEVEKPAPAPIPLTEEEHGVEPFDGPLTDEAAADFDAEERDEREGGH